MEIVIIEFEDSADQSNSLWAFSEHLRQRTGFSTQGMNSLDSNQ
jgi:hypothetical protein